MLLVFHMLRFPCQENTFPLKVHLFAVVQISFPVCSESLLFHSPSIPASIQNHSLSISKYEVKVYERFSYIQYFISLSSVYNLASSNMSYDTVLPGNKPYVSRSTATCLAIHLILSNKHLVFGFWNSTQGVFLCLSHPFLSRLASVFYSFFTVEVLQDSFYNPHSSRLFLLVPQL